jgi:hypothetical protein
VATSAVTEWEKVPQASPVDPDAETQRFYVDALKALNDARVPFLVGGGYAMAHYTGIKRNTKDLDIFIRPADRDRTLTTLTAAGFRTEFFYPFWISKALHKEAFIDILHSSGNGICVVDDEWFANAGEIDVHGYPSPLVPAEEQLWSKAFVQDRDRFDGADVNHLILRHGERLDWERLLRRFHTHERVLQAHVLLFEYAYPSECHRVPEWVRRRLIERLSHRPAPEGRVCRGTNLAVRGYGIAVREWGFADGRMRPHGPLSRQELDQLPEP